MPRYIDEHKLAKLNLNGLETYLKTLGDFDFQGYERRDRVRCAHFMREDLQSARIVSWWLPLERDESRAWRALMGSFIEQWGEDQDLSDPEALEHLLKEGEQRAPSSEAEAALRTEVEELRREVIELRTLIPRKAKAEFD